MSFHETKTSFSETSSEISKPKNEYDPDRRIEVNQKTEQRQGRFSDLHISGFHPFRQLAQFFIKKLQSYDNISVQSVEKTADIKNTPSVVHLPNMSEISKERYDPDQRVSSDYKAETNVADKRYNPDEHIYTKELFKETYPVPNKESNDSNDVIKYDQNSIRELSENEKQNLKNETGWSDKIIDAIENIEQYEEIYKNANLKEAIIDGRECLIKDINWDYVDPKTGMTNSERVKKGLVPIDSKTGEKIELHHMGQKFDAPFAELTENSEHGDGNHKTLHPNCDESWRNIPGNINQYNEEKKQHWKVRLETEF